MFHMEHCVFCAVLSPGTNKTNCGRPCDRHEVKLRDRVGMEHPLTADVGCRNTLFNAVPQSGGRGRAAASRRAACGTFASSCWMSRGPRPARLLDLYRGSWPGDHGKGSLEHLQATNRVGVTRGTLEERRNPLAIL